MTEKDYRGKASFNAKIPIRSLTVTLDDGKY